MDHRRASRALTAGAGLAVVALSWAIPVSADPTDDAFVSALTAAGVGVDNPADTAALGQSVCPMISQNSSSVGSAVSAVSNATSPITGQPSVSPEMAELFTDIAVQMYCPQMVSQLAGGQVPELPGIPGLTGGGVPGIPAIPAIPGL